MPSGFAARLSAFHAGGHAERAASLRSRSLATRRSTASAPAPVGRPGADPRVGHDGVLVLAEHVLQLLRGLDERLAALAELVRRELRRVPRTLHADPARMEARIVRLVVEPRERLPRPSPFRAPDLAERRLGSAASRLGDALEPVEEREVPVARERAHDHDSRLGALVFERPEQP